MYFSFTGVALINYLVLSKHTLWSYQKILVKFSIHCTGIKIIILHFKYKEKFN